MHRKGREDGIFRESGIHHGGAGKAWLSFSKKIWAKAVFIHDMGEYESNFRTQEILDKFLKELGDNAKRIQ